METISIEFTKIFINIVYTKTTLIAWYSKTFLHNVIKLSIIIVSNNSPKQPRDIKSKTVLKKTPTDVYIFFLVKCIQGGTH